MIHPVREGTVPVHGTDVWYQESGQGPAILLLHAGVADHRMWQFQIGPLAAQHRVVAWDAPGFGKSILAPGEFSDAQAIVDLMDALEIDRADLVGCSMGGAAAIRVALTTPDRVRSLVLVGSGVHGFTGELEGPDIYRACEQAEAAGEWERLIELEAQVWLAGLGRPLSAVPPDLLDLYREMNRDHYLRAWNPDAVPTDNLSFDLDRLGEISAPTLVLIGDEDVPEIELQAAMMAEQIPGAHRVTIRHCAHLPSLERASEFNQIVGTWLDGLRDQGAEG